MHTLPRAYRFCPPIPFCATQLRARWYAVTSILGR